MNLLTLLIITGSKTAYESLNQIIRKLDIRKSQVFIEADVLDITANGDFKFGTSIFAGDGTESGNKMAYTWEAGSVVQLSSLKSQKILLAL